MAGGDGGTTGNAPGDLPEDPGENGPAAPPEKMSWSFYLALGLIVVLVLMVVVINYPAAKANAGLSLTRTNWTLVSLQDRTGILIPAMSGGEVTAQFNGTAGRMGGRSGCNWYSALYTTKDYAINFTMEARTDLGCYDRGIMEQEEEYLADIPRTFSFRVSDSGLTFYDANGKTLLVFVPS